MSTSIQRRVACDACHRKYDRSYLPRHKCTPLVSVLEYTTKLREHNDALQRHHDGVLHIGNVLDRHEREFTQSLNRVIDATNTRFELTWCVLLLLILLLLVIGYKLVWSRT